MNFKNNSKSVITEIICLLYVLLFVYAAISKILDFENFQVQLGQSPLLSPFAIWVSWIVPIAELIIALALIIPKFRSIGLLAALSLMSMFTAYIFIILHYSSFVPCSCGGILEKMTWNIHLIFNVVFIVLAALAIVMHFKNRKEGTFAGIKLFPVRIILITAVFSTTAMVVLFLSSEEIMHHQNPFIRRYPQHPIALKNNIDLKFNSYYFAGHANQKMYLGNFTDPLNMVEIDPLSNQRRDIKIVVNSKDRHYKMVKIVIKGSYFYLIDGNIPFILRGSTADWRITKEFKSCPYFSIAQPIDSSTIAFRTGRGKNAEHVLGVFNPDSIPNKSYNEKLLQKQLDGVFDTDGILLSSENQKAMVYLYYYRNEFLLADKKGNLLSRGHTIDTISKAQIKVAFLKDRGERKMAAPPLVVNESAVICQNLLFVQSRIPGRFEPKKLWKQAEIIDVYNLNNNTYLLSFAIYKSQNKKLQYFYVTTTHLYALVSNELIIYDLKKIIKKEMKDIGLREIR